MRLNASTCIALLICYIGLSLTFTVAGDQKNLFDLSIDELLLMELEIASVKSENIAQVPAVVSRYEADDMARMGLRTLMDMLNFIPGFLVIDAEIGTKAVMIRGLVEGFNQKILFLLDGVPYWQPSHGDNALMGMPLSMISHVEVIRGPGAVIYGTNASAGVVNVITKKKKEDMIALRGGSNGLMVGEFYFLHLFGSESQVSVAAGSQRHDGYQGFYNHREPPPFYPAETPRTGFIDRYNESDAVMIRLKHHEFNMGLHVFGSESSGLAAAASIVNKGVLSYRGALLHANYTMSGAQTEYRFYADYNRFFLKIPTQALFSGRYSGTQSFSNHGESNYRLRGGARLNYIFSNSLSWLSGVEIEERSIGEYGNTPDDPALSRVMTMEPGKVTEQSAYTQLDWRSGNWRFLMGGRFTDNEQSGSDFMPRGSLIYKIDDERSMKLLYSVGFNSPNFIQTQLKIPFVVSGDPNLIAETVETIDLAYTSSSKTRLFVVNAYYLEAADFILRVPNPNAPGTVFANVGNFDRSGAELDYQHALKKGKVFANLAWQREGNQEDVVDNTAVMAPEWRASIGGFYNLIGNHHVGGSLFYIGEREAADTAILVNMDYYHQSEEMRVFVGLRNILEEELFHPDIQNYRANRTSPGVNPELGLEAGLSWRF